MRALTVLLVWFTASAGLRAQDISTTLSFPALGKKGREVCALLASYDTNKDYMALSKAVMVMRTVSTFTNAAMQRAALLADLQILNRSTMGIDKAFDEAHAHVFVDDALGPVGFRWPKQEEERRAANRKLQERVYRNVVLKHVAQNSRRAASWRLKTMVLNHNAEGLGYATNAINQIITETETRKELFDAVGAMQKVVERWGPGSAKHK